MKKSVQSLLKKINYIEAEIEIQKQILFTLSSAQKVEIEKIVKNIAREKKHIEELRLQIKKIDPEEFNKLIRIEKSVAAFQKLSTGKKFTSVESMTLEKPCVITDSEGNSIECLVKACDEQGDWTVISLKGDLITLRNSEVLKSSA